MNTKISSALVFSTFFVFFATPFALDGLRAQDPPKGQLESALRFKPIQKNDVEIDIPTDDEVGQCEISFYDGKRGYLITGPQKTTIRIFLDANGDGRVDQWSYFRNGVEVYRDVDSTGDGKMDQFRWLNGAGTRWGVDTNGDMEIDYWKMISAEEVSREIVLALATNDRARFLRVALTPEELRGLELGASYNETISKKIAALETGFDEAVKAVGLNGDSQWFQLNAVMPGTVPGGMRGNKRDLIVYENAVATAGNGSETKQVALGTLVKIDDGIWRTLDAPKAYDDNQYLYTFIPPALGLQASGPQTDGDVVALFREVQAIQAEIPALPLEKRAEKHGEAIVRMLKIIAKSATEEDRDLWIRQVADTIMDASQRNEFPQGADQLKVLYENVKKTGNDELAAHVRNRQIMTDYYRDMLGNEVDDMVLQLRWLENLEAFVTEYEKTEAGIEGMMQLASYREMTGKSAEESVKWYTKVAELAAGKPIGEKAKGAIRRLESTDKAIPFKTTDVSGKPFDLASLKGAYVLLCFWDSRVANELPAVKAVADKFSPAGLKVVGVNLDYDATTMKNAVGKLSFPWTQLYAPGGLDGAPAVYWGIQSTPYMILYGKDGKVVRPNVLSPGDLQQVMAELTK